MIEPLRLVDGPIAPLADHAKRTETREQMVERMAAHLVEREAFGNEADAIRSLMWSKSFSSFEVLRFVDDARQKAMQSVVAREMSTP